LHFARLRQRRRRKSEGRSTDTHASSGESSFEGKRKAKREREHLGQDYGIEDAQGLTEQNLNAQREGWGVWKKIKHHAASLAEQGLWMCLFDGLIHSGRLDSAHGAGAGMIWAVGAVVCCSLRSSGDVSQNGDSCGAEAKRIGRKIKKAYHHVKKKVVQTVHRVKEKAKSVIGIAKAGLKECGGSILGIVTNPASILSAATCVKGVANKVVKDVKKEADKVATDVREGAQHLKNETRKEIATMRQLASKSASEAVSAVVNKADEVKKKVEEGKLSAAAAIDAVKNSAVSEGVKETVEISSQTGELKSKLMDAANKDSATIARDVKKIS